MSTRERYSFDVKSAAAYLCIAPSTLYGIAERREIAHLRTRGKVTTRVRNGREETLRVSGRLKFSQDDLDAWLLAHRSPMRLESSAPVPATGTPIDDLPMPAVRRFAR